MDSAPDEVKGNATLQYALKKEAGRDYQTNAGQHANRRAALSAAGAFRVLIPPKTFSRATSARWSNEVHQVARFVGVEVEDEKGKRYHVRDTLPVPVGSKDARASVDPGTDAKRASQREDLKEYAQALYGFLGSGELTLQNDGIKMRALPGFQTTMQEARVTGIGSFEYFMWLFPGMFTIKGERQRKSVARAGI